MKRNDLIGAIPETAQLERNVSHASIREAGVDGVRDVKAAEQQRGPNQQHRTGGNLHSDQGRETMELFKQLNANGTTIVQVTHSEANAAYGNRIVQLLDGWVVK